MSLVWEFSVISQEQSWEAYFLTRTDFLPVPTAPWISRFWACSLWLWWVNLQCNSLIALVIVLTPWIRRTLLSTLNCQVGCNSHIFLQELTSLHWYQQLQRLESLNPTDFHLKKKSTCLEQVYFLCLTKKNLGKVLSRHSALYFDCLPSNVLIEFIKHCIPGANWETDLWWA